MNNNVTPSGMNEETWHKFVREVESVVEKYYQNNAKQQIKESKFSRRWRLLQCIWVE